MITFLRTHSWLNWVDEDDDEDEVGLKEKPEDTRTFCIGLYSIQMILFYIMQPSMFGKLHLAHCKYTNAT